MSERDSVQNVIFEELAASRTITLFESIHAESAQSVIQKLLYLESKDETKPVKLYINSPGGEVNSGFAIYDVLRYIKPEVKIICSGLCASIATIILLGAKKENRISLPNSRFLIHQPLISGSVQGVATDLEITANEINKTKKKINEMLSKETGQPLERVSRDTERDYWMSSSEALEYGLIARIITNRNEIE